jgi:hypothetical protein
MKVTKTISYCFFFLLFLAALEIAYRIFLYVTFPNQFRFQQQQEKIIVLYDNAQWEYEPRFGYTYPHVKIRTIGIRNGLVTGCLEDTFANNQGDIGLSVPDFAKAKHRILIFGDSFTASMVEGETWPHLLANNLNKAFGATDANEVRVRNLARDGYGILQMFDLAAVKIPELKPTLVVFAFTSQSISRDRAWRVKVGEGDDVRMLATIENSANPHFRNSTDIVILVPAATKKWCQEMVSKSPEAQRKDPLLIKALAKTSYIRQENGKLLKANIWDMTSSYIYHFAVHQNPFFGQQHRELSPANPVVKYANFKNDSQFLQSLAKIQAQGIPFVLVHLPLGVSIRDHQEFLLNEQGQSLKNSLEEVTKHTVLPLRPYLGIKDEAAMKLCMKSDDCHPSRFAIHMYAKSIAQILLPLLKKES